MIFFLSLYYLYDPIYLPEPCQVFGAVAGDSTISFLVDGILDWIFILFYFIFLFFIFLFLFHLSLFIFIYLSLVLWQCAIAQGVESEFIPWPLPTSSKPACTNNKSNKPKISIQTHKKITKTKNTN